jgi:hypothetical protein
LELALQFYQRGLHGFPNDFEIDVEVAVRHAIAVTRSRSQGSCFAQHSLSNAGGEIARRQQIDPYSEKFKPRAK